MADKKKTAAPKPVVRVVDPAEREKVLKSAMAQLEKKFGESCTLAAVNKIFSKLSN